MRKRERDKCDRLIEEAVRNISYRSQITLFDCGVERV